MELLYCLLAVLAAFLSGSLPTALLLGKARGIDIRTQGSGNVGATNAFRVLGPRTGLLCLVVDMLKGGLPAFFFPHLFHALANPHWSWGIGLAAIAGHMFSPFLNFRGGKGVATSLGVIMAIAPLATGIVFAAGIVIVLATGYVSLASIAGSFALPLFVAVLGTRTEQPWHAWFSFAITAALGAMVIIKHRANIGRLKRGEENRILRKAKSKKAGGQ